MDNSEEATAQGKSPSGTSILVFFALVFALAIPFWVMGGLTGRQLLPGLPIDALMAVCPVLAALILSYHENGSVGAKVLLKRAIDYKHITLKRWYVPTLLLMPFVMVLSFDVMRLEGTPVPIPQIPIVQTLILCILFFVGALGEELGWSGYVIDPLQHRLGVLQASIVLGAVWAIFHFVALTHAYRSMSWIAWWSLGTVALRVIMVWLYNNAGKSVFAVALFHMTINVTWQLFPINGSYYDPRVTSVILALVAIIVIVIWRPRTLSRFGKAQRDT
ncbi:CAAX protease self-immunity [Acididesulfobacillus acetoxydans]|uniref:CAAX amino terminal protease protein n=1 Tax=Acididesulfobacillus acetoxydans TaxID=1561005 RepID=A0A8S0XZV8_9FIRM|nr:CPBP family intramembrane glutamic endopeptidase [Acididesulfobacillus acetoxydans]CAA7602587.1 CAAX protease self-immunity [Acididesulfobacillus acetoxydans]CEJ07267.1 CAAX amino terminal protease protein [Acididesulfobacillus acetoxydans]